MPPSVTHRQRLGLLCDSGWRLHINPIDAVGVFVKGVVGPFIVGKEEGDHAECEADGEADDVDGGVDAMSGETAGSPFSGSYKIKTFHRTLVSPV